MEGSKSTTDDFIDLENVIAGKNPNLLRVLPGFIIRYLKRIIHQDELNLAIRTNRHLYGLDFLDQILKSFGARIIIQGLNNLEPVGRWTVAANHPLGGLDGMALMWAVGQARKDIVFPVNDLLMNIDNLKELFIPINKHGSNARNVRIIDETYASSKAVLYFPAGLCSRKGRDGICDLEWKKSFITKTRAHKRDIIPAYIEGRNSDWFYNLARWRTRLGIKTNIEMLYLVDEMYKQRNKEIHIIFGQPIPFSIFDRRNSDLVWAKMLKNHVYRLKENPQAVFTY